MSEAIFFYAFSILTVVMVIFMIFQTNPVASVVYLVFAFFGLAGLYVLLQAPFVAVLQILVYAGAIMVLFIFVIMLLNLRKDDLYYDRITLKKIGVGVLALLFAGFLTLYFLKVPVSSFYELPQEFGSPQAVGRLLFLTYLVPFELTSILLLVAVVGAVMLARKE